MKVYSFSLPIRYKRYLDPIGFGLLTSSMERFPGFSWIQWCRARARHELVTAPRWMRQRDLQQALLRGASINDTAFATLVQALNDCPSLQTLDLSQPLGSRGAAVWVEIRCNIEVVNMFQR